MPYGVTVEGDGTNVPKPAVKHPKQFGAAGLSLTPGPCRVAVSWEGPERLNVILQNGSNYRTVDSIPEKPGGGSRQRMLTVGALEGDYVYLAASGRMLDVGTRGTIEVYPLVSIE